MIKLSILILVFIFSLLIIISFFTLWERKLMAGIQRRQGPNYVGSYGVLQAFADGLKLIFKEINFTSGYYYYCYFLSSIFSLVLSLLSWSVIPFNELFIIADINYSLIFILLVSSLNVFTTLFSGWSSNSKYGLLGSLRAGAQMISYELPMTLSIFPVIFITLSANLTNIIQFQINNYWFIFLFPFALIFIITSLAETNRTPFDLPEAESELVAGYNMEYSSITFALFFLAEYNHILFMSALFSILFLGGWAISPLNIWYFIMNATTEYFIFDFFFHYYFSIFNMSFLQVINIILFIKYIFQTFILFCKIYLIASLFVVIRASVPRYKYTQLILLCWKSFIPFLCFLCLFVFVVIIF
jgi:NADH:ubiquinone oxidoreductase subunit H